MLEKPDIPLDRIAACLQAAYGLTAVQIIFLPIGADQNTAVYRIETNDETACFLKLRSGVFDETAVGEKQKGGRKTAVRRADWLVGERKAG